MMQVKSRAANFEDGRTSKSTHPFRAIYCECSSLFLLLSFIQLHENRQHFVRQILWNFIARPQLLSDHRAHGTHLCHRGWSDTVPVPDLRRRSFSLALTCG